MKKLEIPKRTFICDTMATWCQPTSEMCQGCSFYKNTILREPKAILNECVELIKKYGLGPVNSFSKDEIQKIYFDLVSRLNWQYDIRLERKPEDYKE